VRTLRVGLSASNISVRIRRICLRVLGVIIYVVIKVETENWIAQYALQIVDGRRDLVRRYQRKRKTKDAFLCPAMNAVGERRSLTHDLLNLDRVAQSQDVLEILSSNVGAIGIRDFERLLTRRNILERATGSFIVKAPTCGSEDVAAGVALGAGKPDVAASGVKVDSKRLWRGSNADLARVEHVVTVRQRNPGSIRLEVTPVVG